MKIIILVQSVEAERYPELVKTQQETWDSIKHPDVTVLYYYPITITKRGVDGNRLYVGGTEDFSYSFINTIRAFREIMMMEWDFIFKTDNSSYVNVEELVKILSTKPISGFYGGHLHPEITPTKFLEGVGYAISRDVATHLIDVYANMPTHRMGLEDRWIGSLLTDKFEWDTTMEICDYYKLTGSIPTSHLYCCKNNHPDAIKFDDEIRAMHAIHKQLTA